MTALHHPSRLRRRPEPRSAGRAVTIGLVNNMGDEALKVTERQFAQLISLSAGDVDVRLRLFALKRTPRSPRALEYVAACYESAGSATHGDLDALIITGAQPRAARLDEEPYWEELIELIDRAKEHTASTILSCLAAHAGVLHLDGIERRPLPEKCTGVFTFQAQCDHPLAGEKGRGRVTPHSRYNGLLQSDLEFAGYDVLTSSSVHGVDSFTKSFGAQFVFLQGHPEYEANSLAKEYRRDMGPYLRGETDQRPARPKGYFAPEAEIELCVMELRPRQESGRQVMEDLSKIEALAPTEAPWRDAAISFYRNWIETILTSSRGKSTTGPEAELRTFEDVSGRNDARSALRIAPS
jgi:homoserine O-succinyltransferase/O-acetyltransferase